MSKNRRPQHGASLIEVLVTILILSFGMLALSGMLAYAVQLPKFSANRANAIILAAGHVEKMRANIEAFEAGDYAHSNSYGVAYIPAADCTYPNCSAQQLAGVDTNETVANVRRTLSTADDSEAAGIRVVCNGTCAPDNREGDLWVMWQEPGTFAALDVADSDECPSGISFAVQPRCVHIKFRL